ncbi:MAG: LacI family DNA-binding transcriptional regulator [Anaerolineales bacterium]|nr:LacI family DNA-binding transcriptional regulator [Anaerolineales bacterium]
MPRRQRVTIKEIAEEAGVSIQTVSRVLNNRLDVAPDTRKRVKEIIAAHRYRPSNIARGITQGRSYILGVVGMGLKHYGPASVVVGVEKQANELGYTLVLSLIHEVDDFNVEKILSYFESQHVDGIVWAMPDIGNYRDSLIEQISQFAIPIVSVSMQPHHDLTVVDVDNFHGGQIATEHLIEQGNQVIGLITGPSLWWSARQRYLGWKDTLGKAGYERGDDLVFEGDWSAASGEQGLFQLLKDHPDLDAVFASNDLMALGVIKAARKLGLRIPEDLAVVGYDDIPEADYFCPPLTTIHQDIEELGRSAVREVDQVITNRQLGEIVKPVTRLFQPQLIVRESSVTPNTEIA